RKTLDAKQRVGIGKGSEARTVYLDRRAGLFGHLLPDATRLHDRDAVTDDEGAGGLIGRVKEHRSKMCVLGLQPADNGIAASDLEVEGSWRNKLEMRERRDEVYSSAAARLP